MKDPDFFIPRHVYDRVKTALGDTRIVAIVGPRQSGKTTLARKLANTDGRQFLTLDDTEHRRFAADDPDGFLRDYDSVVIDEVQRVPDLLLTIKKMVDEKPRPGRFLITGSVDLFQQSVAPDSLAGRIEHIELFPFTQSEISNSEKPNILDRMFSCDFSVREPIGRTENLAERVLRGGYPEALKRSVDRRREAWLRAYIRTLINRDISDIARVNKAELLTRLVEIAALSSGQLLNLSKFGAQLGIDSKTVDRWLSLLEQLFLVRRVRAWHHSERKRLVKAQKLHFLDSGLLCAIRKINSTTINRDRKQYGTLLECFVFSEILKLTALQDDWISINHFRDKDKVEVDLVLERSPGEIVGIEIKARATVRPSDFKGLKRLNDLCRERFVCGIVLHDGEKIQKMYPRMFALPIKTLWEN